MVLSAIKGPRYGAMKSSRGGPREPAGRTAIRAATLIAIHSTYNWSVLSASASLITVALSLAGESADLSDSSVRIPINSPVYSDPISPGIPISSRSPFRFQIAQGMRSFRHIDFLTFVTAVGQPFLDCFALVRRMLSPASSMR